MDKKLKELKQDFNQSIPSSFTDKDRERVFEKIHNPKKEKGYGLIPKTITGFAILATTILLVFIYSNEASSPLPQNQGGTSGVGGNLTDDFFSEEGEETVGEDYRTKLVERSYFIFNYHLVSVGDQFDSFTVTNIEENEKGKVISFESEELISLAGDLIYRDEWLFQFDEYSSGLNYLPIEVNDLGNFVQFKLVDESNFFKALYDFTEEEIPPPITLTTEKIDYIISKSGSEVIIYYSDDEIRADLYTTPLEIEEKLIEVYDDYRKGHDQSLLVDLEAIDLIKLYLYGSALKDEETVKTFFSQTPEQNLYELAEILDHVGKMLFIEYLQTDNIVDVSLNYDVPVKLILIKNEQDVWQINFSIFEDSA